MKLLFLVAALPTFPLDGVTLPIEELLPQFAKDYEVTIGTFAGSIDAEAHALERGASEVLRLPVRSKRQVLPMVPPGISSYYSADATSLLKDRAFDLVVSHRLHTAFVGSSPKADRRVLIVQDLSLIHI